MTCPACRHENPAHAKFCVECGARLALRCSRCGTELPAGAKFCLECGTRVAAAEAETPAAAPAAAKPPAVPDFQSRLASYTPKHLAQKILTSRSALEGERRQVTVLFSDVAGFTPLAERLDPEDVHRIMDRCFELITAEVHRFEGAINQYTGDGVMALFGAPIAHEDGPRRAVHAALGIQRALRDYSRELQAQGGPPLQMRIGINTGPVVVGRIGDDLRMDYTAVGDTTNLAARMQQIARPGSVVVSEATHRLVSGFFETLDLGEVPVKGHSPVRAWEVIRPRLRRARDAAVERGLTPLVGRSREVEILLERFAEAKAGHGQVVFISGDAGIGKSRLLLEFRRRLVESGEAVTWLEGQCISFGQSIPFLPLIDQLRENFGIEEFDGEPEIIAKVEHAMRRMGGLEPHIPYLRYLLAVDPGDPAISAIDASARRKRILDAMRALALRGAAIRPIVFVFEDLHWVDGSTEEYLGSLIGSVASAPVLLVMTYRVGYNAPFGTRSFYTTLTLHTLSEAEALAMAGRILGSERFPPELRAALMEKAEGVPLFIEEVTKTLLDLGVLRRDNGGYRMVKGMGEVKVPDTIHGIIMARLDRLGEDGKRTVQLASVIGRQFLHRLLERIAGLTGQLEGLLQELKALEIIYEQGLLPEPAYIFKHAVIQDVAYNSLLKERRRELHRAVGAAIEELYPDRLAEHYQELAHHFVHGEHWEKAFEYLVRSGDKAKDAFASQTALDFYAKALEVAAHMTPPPAAGRLAVVRQRRAEVWRLMARYLEAIAELERMLEVARAGGDRFAEAQAVVDLALAHWLTFSSEHMGDAKRFAEQALALGRDIGDEHAVAKSLSYLGLIDQVGGDMVAADVKLAESLRLARAGAFKDAIAQNLTWLGAHANWRGEFHKAIPLCRDAEETARENHDGFAELFALAFRCLALAGLGHYREALDVIHQGLTLARERESMFVVGRLTNSLGWLHQELGDFERALEYDRQGVDLGRQVHNPNVEISSLINLAWDHLHQGDPAKALGILEETFVRVDKHAFGAHRWRWWIHLQAYIAEALIALGQPEQALRHVEEGMVKSRATGSLKYVGRGHLLRGRIALGARDLRRAGEDFSAALDIGRRMEYPHLIWPSAHGLARALALEAGEHPSARGRAEEAHAMARLAADTIRAVADAAPEPRLRSSFLGLPSVRAVFDDLERLRRG
ncbi:MAG TPA: adenylate/guanylate cyclase domain-containing protein [Methylomirabilota bacterium]|nr:adenylate/guanylate cyclase domain-containing protein [Methylomirabilota bacterium]